MQAGKGEGEVTGAQAQPSDQGFYRAVEELEKAQEKEQQEAEKGGEAFRQKLLHQPTQEQKSQQDSRGHPCDNTGRQQRDLYPVCPVDEAGGKSVHREGCDKQQYIINRSAHKHHQNLYHYSILFRRGQSGSEKENRE